MKTCGKCKTEYPATTEYFRRNENSKDGLFIWCKKCKNEADNKSYYKNIVENHRKRKEWRDKNKEIKRKQDKQYREKMKIRNPDDIACPEEKTCASCHKIKASDRFFRKATSKDGLNGYCKKCTKMRNNKSYQKHKDKRKIKDKEYQKLNKEKISIAHKNYYKMHKRKIKNYKRLWQQKNHKRIFEKAKIYRTEHKMVRNSNDKNRKLTDINYRIVCNLRTRLSNSMKHLKKSNHTMKLVGCPITELKQYLELQFLQNMAWHNYGRGNDRWSIDHIRPCSSFNLSVPEQQKICFHYSNLRPLWNIDNFKKNSFYNGKYIRKITQ